MVLAEDLPAAVVPAEDGKSIAAIGNSYGNNNPIGISRTYNIYNINFLIIVIFRRKGRYCIK